MNSKLNCSFNEFMYNDLIDRIKYIKKQERKNLRDEKYDKRKFKNKNLLGPSLSESSFDEISSKNSDHTELQQGENFKIPSIIELVRGTPYHPKAKVKIAVRV